MGYGNRPRPRGIEQTENRRARGGRKGMGDRVQAETWHEGFARVNGVSLHYVHQGEGPLVLLLHGFPEFWFSWRYQLPALAEAGYHAVAPDLRGYNLSEKPDSGYDIETLSEDVAELISSFGQDKAVVVGHDWGGAIAWHTATFRPRRVEKLIVMNCPHPNIFARGVLKPSQLRKSWYMFFFQLPWLPEWLLSRKDYSFVMATLRGSAMHKDAFDRETLRRYRDAIAAPYALSRALEYYRRMLRDLAVRRNVPWDATVEVPTLVIWGEQDRFLGKELNNGLSRWVRDLTVHYIAEAGHWVQQERPLEVNRLMLDFLRASSGTQQRREGAAAARPSRHRNKAGSGRRRRAKGLEREGGRKGS